LSFDDFAGTLNAEVGMGAVKRGWIIFEKPSQEIVKERLQGEEVRLFDDYVNKTLH
jgi:hypothetical protein